jgi:alkylation response protein AidB-like acyl-CoA dehydrogenase
MQAGVTMTKGDAMSAESDWLGIVRELGPTLAERASAHDADDSFVAENYEALKARKLFSAGIPAELGGGGASYGTMVEIVREIAHYCSSTALAFSMHTHPVATMTYGWRAGNKGPEGLLKRIAAENLVVMTSGGSDWLAGSGKLEKVEGGFKMTGRKIFGSGGPGAQIFLTMGIYDDPQTGPTVIHFPVPLNSPGVTPLDNWRTLGMRGTGSNDVMLDGVFIPDAAMGGLRRPAGKWHPATHAVALNALPIVYGAYVGIAEAARDLALEMSRKKKDDPGLPYLVGEMENQLVTAQLALASAVTLATTAKPGPEATSAMLVRRTIIGGAVLRTVDKAMDVAGGASFFRAAKLERLFRDAQASRFHPLPEKQQTRLTGRVVLGLDIDG